MTDNELKFDINGKRRNQSDLSYIDCCMRLTDDSKSFEEMSNDDLDSIYAVALGHWAYHLTRQGYIDALNKKRVELRDSGGWKVSEQNYRIS